MSRRTASAGCRIEPGGSRGGICSWASTCAWPLCWPWANKKPAEEKFLAGHTCPRPFSYLFYVASKPAGSNDHEIDVVIRLHRLPVKAPKRLPSPASGRGGSGDDDKGHS